MGYGATMLVYIKDDLAIGGASFLAQQPKSNTTVSKQCLAPGSNHPGVFSYRGFYFMLVPEDGGWSGAVLHNGSAMRAEFNGRSVWPVRRRAKTQIRQFIKFQLAPFNQ